MTCTLQYPKKTPYEVRKEMDRIEKSDSKPLTSCEINGIDWEKRIQNRQKRRTRDMNKKADAWKDYLQGAVAARGVNYLDERLGGGRDGYPSTLGNTVNNVGTLSGLFLDKTPTMEEFAKMESDGYGWVPGNAARRIMLRRKQVNDKLKGKPSTVYSEHFGKGTSSLLWTLGAAGLGALLAGKASKGSPDALHATIGGGALGGIAGLLGSTLARGVGSASAYFTPTRTDKEQQEYEQDSPHLSNWLLPGVADYNHFKSLGVHNRMLKEYMDEQEKKKGTEKEADMVKKSFNKAATPDSIKDDPALATAFALGMTGLLGWKIYNLMHREDKPKKPKQPQMQPQYEIIDLSKSASYVMLKRAAEEAKTKDIIKKLQDQVANNYINSLKKERDRSLKSDLLNGALSGGLNGAQYGLLSGLLFGTTVGPAKDLTKGSDRSMWQSIGRGAGLGGASGMGAGALIGAGVGALNTWATRDLRKKRAIQKLQELGITD